MPPCQEEEKATHTREYTGRVARKLARAKLSEAIKCSKRQCLAELLGMVDGNSWERPNKVIMTQLGCQSRSQPTCPEKLQKIVNTLFPRWELLKYEMDEEQEDTSLITREELLKANSRNGNSKAPGMENIPKVALKTAPEMFLDMSNTCLAQEASPERWKQQRLVLRHPTTGGAYLIHEHFGIVYYTTRAAI
uniref:Uncharacterized protein n=1 Tax=Bracon brevicornis TaxID=1563983 RepID=A0A6V7JGY8_9HYME